MWHSTRGSRPRTRQVPKREARVILVSVPCSERVDFAADHQGPQAALRSVVVRGHAGGSHEDKQFLDVPLDTPAQVALGGCRVLGVGTALGQQFPLQLLLDPLPLPCLGMGEALGRRVNVMDSLCHQRPAPASETPSDVDSGWGFALCPASPRWRRTQLIRKPLLFTIAVSPAPPRPSPPCWASPGDEDMLTWTGTTGRSMTSRVRSIRRNWRQASKTCSTRWVGVVRWRAKPSGLPGTFLPGSLLAADFLMPGIPLGPPRFGLSLQRLYR